MPTKALASAETLLGFARSGKRERKSGGNEPTTPRPTAAARKRRQTETPQKPLATCGAEVTTSDKREPKPNKLRPLPLAADGVVIPPKEVTAPKEPEPEDEEGAAAKVIPSVEDTPTGEDDDVAAKLLPEEKKKFRKAWDMIRACWVKNQLEATKKSKKDYIQRRKDARARWAVAGADDKLKTLRAYRAQATVQSDTATILKDLEEKLEDEKQGEEINGEARPGKHNNFKAKWWWAQSKMLTWQGAFGDFSEEALPFDVAALRLLPDKVAALLWDMPKIKELWEEFKEHIKANTEFYRIRHYAIAFEVCVQTLEEKGIVRVHAHAFCAANHKVSIRSPEPFVFRGSIPQASFTTGAPGMNRRGRQEMSMNGGFYYLLMPKVGAIVSIGTKRLFKDVAVNPQWITHYLQDERGQ